MQFLNNNGKGKERGELGLFSVLFFLALYLIGTVELSSFHAVIHTTGSDSELHSLVNENNACHQSVYHNKKDESCEHKSHVVALKKCPLCHLSLQSFHLFNTKPDLELRIVAASNKGSVYD
ncbi:MAG TPA: hypothetical protein VIS49_05355 [Cyclobacteriaceae bacterium]